MDTSQHSTDQPYVMCDKEKYNLENLVVISIFNCISFNSVSLAISFQNFVHPKLYKRAFGNSLDLFAD